jgi:hypothetical protein
MSYDLHLYQRPSAGEAYVANITAVARGWRRTVRALGGYGVGAFRVGAGDLTAIELADWYNNYLGCVVREISYGMLSWEGFICELRLRRGGLEYVRSLDPEWWHNAVETIYTMPDGTKTGTGLTIQTASAAEYGRMEYEIVLGRSTMLGAQALRDRHLAEYMWPRSRLAGRVALGAVDDEPDELWVFCAGYWETLNWRHVGNTPSWPTVQGEASAVVASLVGTSEFVTAGRIESNSLDVMVMPPAEAMPVPQRVGDLIGLVVEQGDVAGNVWQCGVYAGRELVYEPAPVEPDYYLQGGRLTDRGGGEVVPSLMPAGVLVRSLDAPVAGVPVGSLLGEARAWDDAAVGYVEEVEFVAPGGLVLRWQGEEEQIGLQEGRHGDWYRRWVESERLRREEERRQREEERRRREEEKAKK